APLARRLRRTPPPHRLLLPRRRLRPGRAGRSRRRARLSIPGDHRPRRAARRDGVRPPRPRRRDHPADRRRADHRRRRPGRPGQPRRPPDPARPNPRRLRQPLPPDHGRPPPGGGGFPQLLLSSSAPLVPWSPDQGGRGVGGIARPRRRPPPPPRPRPAARPRRWPDPAHRLPPGSPQPPRRRRPAAGGRAPASILWRIIRPRQRRRRVAAQPRPRRHAAGRPPGRPRRAGRRGRRRHRQRPLPPTGAPPVAGRAGRDPPPRHARRHPPRAPPQRRVPPPRARGDGDPLRPLPPSDPRVRGDRRALRRVRSVPGSGLHLPPAPERRRQPGAGPGRRLPRRAARPLPGEPGGRRDPPGRRAGLDRQTQAGRVFPALPGSAAPRPGGRRRAARHRERPRQGPPPARPRPRLLGRLDRLLPDRPLAGRSARPRPVSRPLPERGPGRRARHRHRLPARDPGAPDRPRLRRVRPRPGGDGLRFFHLPPALGRARRRQGPRPARAGSGPDRQTQRTPLRPRTGPGASADPGVRRAQKRPALEAPGRDRRPTSRLPPPRHPALRRDGDRLSTLNRPGADPADGDGRPRRRPVGQGLLRRRPLRQDRFFGPRHAELGRGVPGADRRRRPRPGRSEPARLRRRAGLRHDLRRRHRRHLPDREPGPDPNPAPDPAPLPRRPGGPGRHRPPRPDPRRRRQPLRQGPRSPPPRPQLRPDLRPPQPGADPARNPRRRPLPGAGLAGGDGPGRVHRRPSRSTPPGDESQALPRGDGPPLGPISRRRSGARGGPQNHPRRVQATDGIRLLRLPEGSRGGVCRAGLPVLLAEAALPGRVRLRPAQQPADGVLPAPRLDQRRQAARPPRSAAGPQPKRRPLLRRRRRDPDRPRLRGWPGRGSRSPDRARARRRRRLSLPGRSGPPRPLAPGSRRAVGRGRRRRPLRPRPPGSPLAARPVPARQALRLRANADRDRQAATAGAADGAGHGRSDAVADGAVGADGDRLRHARPLATLPPAGAAARPPAAAPLHHRRPRTGAGRGAGAGGRVGRLPPAPRHREGDHLFAAGGRVRPAQRDRLPGPLRGAAPDRPRRAVPARRRHVPAPRPQPQPDRPPPPPPGSRPRPNRSPGPDPRPPRDRRRRRRPRPPGRRPVGSATTQRARPRPPPGCPGRAQLPV
ncbi:MAG: Error-prone repair homolog of DNA polymerase III alpha subunit, partial [uncultured Thermomicrobiales bacterium]